MNPIFPELPHPLGVYTLSRLLELRENSALYEARQTHVDRAVVLEVLQPGVPHASEVAFLAQARHRVATGGIPHVADVFESLRADGIWFLTQERPQGRSLADIAEAGETLAVQGICYVIAAAAEMYDAYHRQGLIALPLAPSSVFIEDTGEVHFLSPLVEGMENNPPAQMQALAAALWAVCPQDKAPGLGRAVTLIQWLNEGVDGQFLQWSDIRETAVTIINQLVSNAQPDENKTFLTRVTDNISKTPKVVKLRQLFTRWGTHIGAAAGIVLFLTWMGSFFGMGTPEALTVDGSSVIICQEAGKNELVQRYPVSVQQYADFMQAFNDLDEEQRQELRDKMIGACDDPTPANWEEQWERGDVQAPVTGVSYWQALLYAHFSGGNLPTVAQIQTVQAVGAASADLEWTRSEMESPLPGIYNGSTYLLVDQHGKVVPANYRDWKSAHCGFRVAYPENHE